MSGHVKMSTAQRAKQFLPFAGVRGLDEALALKEQELLFTSESVLSEEQLARLDEALRVLTPGDEIILEYYDGGCYRTEKGRAEKLDPAGRLLIFNGKRISFSSVRELRPA